MCKCESAPSSPLICQHACCPLGPHSLPTHKRKGIGREGLESGSAAIKFSPLPLLASPADMTLGRLCWNQAWVLDCPTLHAEPVGSITCPFWHCDTWIKFVLPMQATFRIVHNPLSLGRAPGLCHSTSRSFSVNSLPQTSTLAVGIASSP